MLAALLKAAEKAVSKAEAKYAAALEHERQLITGALGEICDHGQKHGSPLGGDYWQTRWRAERELAAAKRLLGNLQAAWDELPHPPPDLPLKQGYEWRERIEVRPGSEGAKQKIGIGELIRIEQA